jgi:hypothetical protein
MQQTKDDECRSSAALRISSRESIGEVPCRESGTHAGASENGSAAVPIGENASRKFEIWMWGGGMRETSLTVKHPDEYTFGGRQRCFVWQFLTNDFYSKEIRGARLLRLCRLTARRGAPKKTGLPQCCCVTSASKGSVAIRYPAMLPATKRTT